MFRVWQRAAAGEDLVQGHASPSANGGPPLDAVMPGNLRLPGHRHQLRQCQPQGLLYQPRYLQRIAVEVLPHELEILRRVRRRAVDGEERRYLSGPIVLPRRGMQGQQADNRLVEFAESMLRRPFVAKAQPGKEAIERQNGGN